VEDSAFFMAIYYVACVRRPAHRNLYFRNNDNGVPGSPRRGDVSSSSPEPLITVTVGPIGGFWSESTRSPSGHSQPVYSISSFTTVVDEVAVWF
jgi:hypothetical protein